MNHPTLIAALLVAAGLAACDKPTVVNVPPPAVGVPGPAGPQGSTGSEGVKGDTGKPGDDAAVIVVPAASSPSN